jgi:ADP-heptose:LPS heptosyltransferase
MPTPATLAEIEELAQGDLDRARRLLPPTPEGLRARLLLRWAGIATRQELGYGTTASSATAAAPPLNAETLAAPSLTASGLTPPAITLQSVTTALPPAPAPGGILIILPNNPGDVIMGLHAVDALHSQGFGPIDYLIDSECRALVEGHPQLRRALVAPRKFVREQVRRGEVTAAWSELDQFARQLERSTYRRVANLFQDEAGAYLCTLAGVEPTSAGDRSNGSWGTERSEKKFGLQLGGEGQRVIPDPWSRHLFAIPANRAATTLHAVDVYCRICGVTPLRPPRARFPGPTPAIIQRLTILAKGPASAGIAPATADTAPLLLRPLALQCGSAWPGKRWPADHWATFVRKLLAATPSAAPSVLSASAEGAPPAEILLVGSPEERDAAESLLADLTPLQRRRVRNLCGATTLAELPHLLGRCRALVTGDTFAMHAAAAVGCPTYALFGPSSSSETGPYSPGTWTVTANPAAHLSAHPRTPSDPRPAAEVPKQPLPLADFNFAAERHPAMAAIPPASLAALVLRGEFLERPAEPLLRLQESRWDEPTRARWLTGVGPNLPPDAPSMLTTLLPDLSQTPPEALATARELLSLLDGPSATAEALRAVQPLESQLQELTQDSLAWESYRIELNGLPVADLATHRRLRAELLRRLLGSISERSPETSG